MECLLFTVSLLRTVGQVLKINLLYSRVSTTTMWFSAERKSYGNLFRTYILIIYPLLLQVMCITEANSLRVIVMWKTSLPTGLWCQNSGRWSTLIHARIYFQSNFFLFLSFILVRNGWTCLISASHFFRAFTYLLNSIPNFTDNNIVNIIRYGEDYYAASEINYINQINPMTLDTIERVSASIIHSFLVFFFL